MTLLEQARLWVEAQADENAEEDRIGLALAYLLTRLEQWHDDDFNATLRDCFEANEWPLTQEAR